MKGEVYITDDRIQLVNADGMLNDGIVMDKIAKDITEEFCKVVHTPNACILDVGFGLGYSANKFYELGVKSLTIIEINEQIYRKAQEWAEDKPNVKVLMGDWELVIPELRTAGQKYDGIFMDTYGDDLRKYKYFEKCAELVADENCILSIYEYPTIRKESTLNFVRALLTKDKNYPLNLKPEHKICWTYYVAGKFRKDKFFERYDDFLSDELCESIIEENKDTLLYKEATATIDHIDHSRKFYYTPIIYNKELEDRLNNTIFKRFKPVNMNDLWIGLFKYEEGHGYDRHVESLKGMPLDDKEQYVDTIDISLSNNGETQIYDDFRKNNRLIYSTIHSKKGQMLSYKTYQHVQYNKLDKGVRYQLLIFLKNSDYNKFLI